MSLKINIGPMYAGKSTELISTLTRMADFGKACAYFNHQKDIRLSESSDGLVSTHNSGFQKLSKKIYGAKINILNKELDVSKFQYIGIDEFQFFKDNPEIDSLPDGHPDKIAKYEKTIETIKYWVLVLKKHVVIASLDTDFKINPFGCVHFLIGLCGRDGIKKLTALCMKCDNEDPADAIYNLKIAGSTSIEDPGDSDKYLAVCLKCYQLHNKY
jgi:thymidine kinase